MLIPTQTYGPTKKVEPIEKNYIIGYTDSQGNDYIGVRPDFDKEPWFNELIQSDGLENLCKEFPYQPLRVDKASGLLEPVFSCSYNAKLTNCFHVIYHMRLDSMNQPNYQNTSLKEVPSRTILASNLVEDFGSKQLPDIGYSPNWSEAYHHETPILKFHENSVSGFIESEEDQKNKYGIKNVNVEISSETYKNIPNDWHPNNGSMCPPQQYNPYGMYQNPNMVSNSQSNPYAYNPGYNTNSSYLPQYRTVNPNTVPFMALDNVEEEFARMAERERANMEYATRMNLNMKTTNPTGLDTSPNTVDFSNPESVARMQGMYANPFYNNLNNPNLMAPSTNYPYSMSNPYGGVTNPIYANQYNYPSYGNWWNSTDLSFMEFSKEEMESGKGFRVKLGKSEPLKIKFKPKEKPKIKVKIVRIVLEDEEEVQEEDDELDDKLVGINRKVTRYKWYGEAYKSQVMDLANKIAVYDEARALCLVGSLDDPNVNKRDFRLYYQSCEEKLKWYETQEKINPDMDYRVPFRYRKDPVRIGSKDGYSIFQQYTIPVKEYFTLNDGKVIRFYRFDRAREPNDDEWQVFYEQAEYERDLEIEKKKAQMIEDFAKEQQELSSYNPYNPMDVRIHELKMEDKLRRDQYDIFRTAYGGSVSDEQFDRWWYQSNPQAMPNRVRTEEDIIRQRQQWRRNMGMQHAAVLQNIVPLDPEKVREYKTAQINKIVRDFDRGTMDTCCGLRDFFDNLGYLNVRVCEDNIERQRREALNTSMSVNRYDYTKNLYAMAQPSNWNNHGVNDPYYQNRPHYMEFVNSADYEERKAQFFNYCSSSQGTIPLKPIYK